MKSARRLLVALSCAGSGCVAREAPPVDAPADPILVSIREGVVAAPDSIGAGWARVRVVEDGAGHILVIFRLPKSATDAEVETFLAALDTAAATPPPAVALGGPEIGDSGEVIMHFTAGRYVLGCVRRGPGGHRHASTGEAGVVVVTSETPIQGRDVPPAATLEVPMVDFAYSGPDRWPAGSHMLKVENRGAQEHQVRLIRLRPGSSMQDWLKAEEPGSIGTEVAGVARLGPGGVAFLPVELVAGNYVAYCLMTDPASGRAHVELGMLRAIQVE